MARRLIMAFLAVAISAHAEAQQEGKSVPLSASITGLATVEGSLNTAANAAQLRLSENAKDQFLRELFRSETATASPDGSYQIDEPVLRALAAEIAKKNREPSPKVLSDYFASSRRDASSPGILQYLNSVAHDLGVTVTPNARRTLEADVRKSTEDAAKSGISSARIEDQNRRYIRLAFDHAKSGQLDTAVYSSYRNMLFRSLVRVNIRTVPVGADVVMEGRNIGKTALKKPLEPDKTYTFTFRMAGYKTVDRSFAVQPSVDELDLEEVLIPERKK